MFRQPKATLIAALCFLAAAAASFVSAATLTVTNLNDAGANSLRGQIATAAANDTINFAVSGTITLTSGQLSVNKPLTIHGPGSSVLTVSGNDVNRIFNITDNVSWIDSPVAISGLTLTKGNATPGAWTVCPISGSGGAIFSAESLTLIDVIIDDNKTARNGGGVSWFPSMGGQVFSITDSTVSNNSATCTGSANTGSQGGGLMLSPDTASGLGVTATVALERVRIVNNTAGRFGGGVAYFVPDTLVIKDSVLSGNVAVTGNGGGILLGTTPAQQYGYGSRLALDRSEVSNNTAQYGGGVFAVNDSPAAQSASGAGGLVSVNSTISGNTALTDDGGIALYGNVFAYIMNSTLAFNQATGAGSNAGGMLLNNGFVSGAVPPTENRPNQVSLSNSILAKNLAADSSAPDLNFRVNGTPQSAVEAGFNLIQSYPASSLALAGNGNNIVGVDPMLASLELNGGRTQTHALLASSPAIDMGGPYPNGGPNPVVTTDQRGAGFARQIGSSRDIGAFEYGGSPRNTCLDLNGDGSAGEPGIDGVLLARYLFGLRGAALTSGLTLTGVRSSPSQIASFIGDASAYDVIGRAVAQPTALVDGLILMRLMLGVPDAALLAGISLPTGAALTMAADIRSNINTRCAMSF